MNEDCKCCYLEIIYDYYITHIHSLSLVLTFLIEEAKGAKVSVTIECHIVYTLRPKWRRRESLHTGVSKLVIMHRLIIDLMGQAVVTILCPGEGGTRDRPVKQMHLRKRELTYLDPWESHLCTVKLKSYMYSM